MICILGEGRGHMTQAIAVKEIVERAGHKVAGVVVGAGRKREIPPFFAEAMAMPIEKIPTLDFSFKNNRKVSLAATVAAALRRLPEYVRAIQRLKAMVFHLKPDVILNFFEPVTGLYALTTWKRPPVLAVAHQFMYGHPAYVRGPKLRVQQWIVKGFVRLVGARSFRVALSFYEAADLPARKTRISPPILRRQIFKMKPDADGRFVLVYLLNHGYAEQVIRWHEANPQTVLHCFYDKPGAPAEEKYDKTLTFHRLDGDKFLRMMAQCKYVACTAGFESLAEAAYFGKPLLLVPVENHIEQQINAIDATNIGWGVTDSWFNLDRLSELPARLPNAAFKSWLARADSILLAAIEEAVAGRMIPHFIAGSENIMPDLASHPGGAKIASDGEAHAPAPA